MAVTLNMNTSFLVTSSILYSNEIISINATTELVPLKLAQNNFTPCKALFDALLLGYDLVLFQK